MIDALAQNPPGIWHWLTVSTLLFSIGLYGILTRRNAVGILLSVELMLNAGIMNLLVFNHFIAPATVDGEIFVLFVLAVAAAEAVVALAIFVAVFKHRRTLDVTGDNLLRNVEEYE